MNVTCKNCGWVSFQVTRAYAENEVEQFNKYFETLSNADQESNYGGKGASIEFYEQCFCCNGSYENFRESKDGDCPDGCTLNPIIERSVK